jgi:hypothetical protein
VKPRDIENALIESLFIGVEDHGIPSIAITVRGGCSVQGTGHYSLKGLDMSTLVKELVGVIGTDDITQAAKRYCRVEREDGMITRIGHIMEDRWFSIPSHYPSKEAAA